MCVRREFTRTRGASADWRFLAQAWRISAEMSPFASRFINRRLYPRPHCLPLGRLLVRELHLENVMRAPLLLVAFARQHLRCHQTASVR